MFRPHPLKLVAVLVNGLKAIGERVDSADHFGIVEVLDEVLDVVKASLHFKGNLHGV